jgi:hypothetical protein
MVKEGRTPKLLKNQNKGEAKHKIKAALEGKQRF